MAAHWKHTEKRREVPTKEVRMVRRQQHQTAVILLPHVEKSQQGKISYGQGQLVVWASESTGLTAAHREMPSWLYSDPP